jgi:Ribosomal protein S15P/S13E
MARMHARRKGRSCSRRPMISENPAWVPINATDIEELIVKMAKDGQTSARIGLVLRDQYGVPNVKLATGRTVTEIMTEKGVSPALPEDLSNLMRRAISLNVHLRENRGDISNKRGLQLIESKIRRLERYYKRNGVLPADWKYSLKTAELMLK